MHGLQAVEVEFAEPVVRRLVSFGVRECVVLDVPLEPWYLLQDRGVGVLPVSTEPSLPTPPFLYNPVTYLITAAPLPDPLPSDS